MAKDQQKKTTIEKVSKAAKHKRTNLKKEEPSKLKDDTETSCTSTIAVASKTSGLDEIDSLFANKKKEAKKQQAAAKLSPPKSNQSHDRSGKRIAKVTLSGDRDDTTKIRNGEWVDDGLGGIFNSDGYTGRRDGDSGLKVYKAHLFNKKGFGQTKDCPFDCDCCYI